MIAFKTDITEKGIHNCSFIFTHSSNHSQMHLFGFHNHLNKKKNKPTERQLHIQTKQLNKNETNIY